MDFPDLGSIKALFPKSRFVRFPIPSLAPPFPPNPESRPINKPNPRSQKTYWGLSYERTDVIVVRQLTSV